MDIVIRAATIFAFVFLLTRLLGRRELNSLEPFDLILLVVTGDLVQQGVTQNDESLTGALLAISTIGLLTVALSYLSFRFKRMRPILNGEPIVLIEDGELIMTNLRRQRLTREEIGAEARLEGISSIADVRWAILEANGQNSFVEKRGEG
ncbi:MAG TPA: YetF domain-containing protein [Solirubrobacterales bacterium]|nr:YetF domain-containing protein [Solirubrobacterales bacterium]